MKKVLSRAGIFALLTFSLLAAPMYAQTRQPVKRNVTPRYDVSKETTTKGTVQQVVVKQSRGPLTQANLLLATSKGTVNVPLGPFAMRGKNPVSLAPGQSVTVTGETVTGPRGSMYMARTIETSGKAYNIRNKYGSLIFNPATTIDVNGAHPARHSNGGAR